MVAENILTRQSDIRDAFRRAYERAAAHKLVAYRIDANTYAVPSATDPVTEYTVTHTGAGWSEWTCTCKAGQRGILCQHAATAAYAWSRHTGAVRPCVTAQAPTAATINPLVDMFN